MRPDPAALHGAAFAEGRRLREAAQRRRARHEARMEAHMARIDWNAETRGGIIVA